MRVLNVHQLNLLHAIYENTFKTCTFLKPSLWHQQYNFQADDDGGGGGVADENEDEDKIPFYYYESNSPIFFFWKTIFFLWNQLWGHFQNLRSHSLF